MQKLMIFFLISFLCLSCSENITETTESQETLPTNLFAKNKLENAISVSKARSLKPGSEVKVFGQIMGNRSPFVEERASFILGDPQKIKPCDDKCDAPWDCCCDDKKTIAASVLSIQVLNKDSRVINTALKGQNGLKELSKVIVKGKIAPGSSDQFMIINADEIYVE